LVELASEEMVGVRNDDETFFSWERGNERLHFFCVTEFVIRAMNE
jgi:hypothetical protein